MKLLKKSIITVVLFFVFSFPGNAQGNFNKWVVGLNGPLVVFQKNTLGEKYNVQFPKINISRYISNGLIIDVSGSFNVFGVKDALLSNSFTYNSFDGHVRYDFNLSNNNFVPYVLMGLSFIDLNYRNSNRNTSSNSINFGVGGTFWVLEHVGFNSQLTYKNKYRKDSIIPSHLHFTVGLVYSFRPRIVHISLWKRRKPRRRNKNRKYFAIPQTHH